MRKSLLKVKFKYI